MPEYRRSSGSAVLPGCHRCSRSWRHRSSFDVLRDPVLPGPHRCSRNLSVLPGLHRCSKNMFLNRQILPGLHRCSKNMFQNRQVLPGLHRCSRNLPVVPAPHRCSRRPPQHWKSGYTRDRGNYGPQALFRQRRGSGVVTMGRRTFCKDVRAR